MDYTSVFKNSAKLLWRHKVLLAFGFFLIIGSLPSILGGHAYSRFWLSYFPGFTSSGDPSDALQPLFNFFINPNFALIIGGTVGIFLGFLGIWIVTTIGEIALIRGVADFDDDHTRSLGELLSAGVKLLARIIAIDTVIFLPLFLILLIQLLTVGGGMIAGIQFLTQPGNDPGDLGPIVLVVGLVLLVLILLAIPVTILTMMLRLVAFRSAVLEDLPTRPSISRAWALIRAKLGQIIVVALLLYAVSYAIGMITSILVMPLSFGGMFVMLQSITPGQPPEFANLDGFLTLITLASVIGLLPNLIYRVFSSAVWTMAYREWQRNP